MKYLSESFSAKFEVQQPQVPNDGERNWSWRELAAHPLQLQELQDQEGGYQGYKQLSDPQHDGNLCSLLLCVASSANLVLCR